MFLGANRVEIGEAARMLRVKSTTEGKDQSCCSLQSLPISSHLSACRGSSISMRISRRLSDRTSRASSKGRRTLSMRGFDES